jgi:hypothetical protein
MLTFWGLSRRNAISAFTHFFDMSSTGRFAVWGRTRRSGDGQSRLGIQQNIQIDLRQYLVCCHSCPMNYSGHRIVVDVWLSTLARMGRPCPGAMNAGP